jgi:hypothetical protein
LLVVPPGAPAPAASEATPAEALAPALPPFDACSDAPHAKSGNPSPISGAYQAPGARKVMNNLLLVWRRRVTVPSRGESTSAARAA